MSEQAVGELIKIDHRTFLKRTGSDVLTLYVQEYPEDAELYTNMEVRVEEGSISLYSHVRDAETLKDAMDRVNNITNALFALGQSLEAFGRKTFPELYVVPEKAVAEETLGTAESFEVEPLPNGDFNVHSKF